MKKNFFPLLVLFAIISFQCKKSIQEDQLPPITTVGANTFGCLINGNVWLPGRPAMSIILHSENKLVVAEDFENYSMNGIRIDANYFKSHASTGLGMDLDNIKDTGTYHIYNIGFDDTIGYGPPKDSFAVVKILRCDTIQKIISGTFSFIGTNTQFNKTLNITDGRFDLHYPLILQ